MVVVTNLRRYAVELKVRPRPAAPGDPSIIYGLRFLYPPPPAPPPPAAKGSSSGGQRRLQLRPRNLPLRVFDDGKSTYFQFTAAGDYPAIYAVGSDKAKSVIKALSRWIPGRRPGRLRRSFFAKGTDTTRLFNDAWRESPPRPREPQAIKPERWRSPIRVSSVGGGGGRSPVFAMHDAGPGRYGRRTGWTAALGVRRRGALGVVCSWAWRPTGWRGRGGR